MAWDLYRVLLPSDFVCWLQAQEGGEHLEKLCVLRTRLIIWIRRTILTAKSEQKRAETITFFINVADVSVLRKLLQRLWLTLTN
jgi:hypothetical protein